MESSVNQHLDVKINEALNKSLYIVLEAKSKGMFVELGKDMKICFVYFDNRNPLGDHSFKRPRFDRPLSSLL